MRPVGTAVELEQRRKEAVRQLRAGARVVDVCRDFGVSKTAVLNWKRAASEGGLRALGSTPQHVPQSRLTALHKQQLQSILRKGAAAYGYPTDLWTCARIAEVIKQTFGIDYHPGYVSRILHSIGFSCQKPAVRARERDPEAAEQFRKETGGETSKKGADRNASIVLIDESGFMLQPLVRRTWAPRGQTPVLDAWDRHDRLTAITALVLSPKWRRCSLYFELLDHNAQYDDFIWFLIQLRKEVNRRLLVVWDRLGAHRKAERILRKLGCEWLDFEYLPAYCPELNPVEHVWSTTKWGRLSNWPAADVAALRDRVTEDLKNQASEQQLLHNHFRWAGLDLN